MFETARLKLTTWYLIIIMMISFLFSMVIYTGIDREFERFRRIQILREEREREGLIIIPPTRYPVINSVTISEAEDRIKITLILINILILVLSGIASYFLAGRTLKPIKEMIDEQNRFITDSSHELRTPLTALRSEIEVYLRDKKLNISDAKTLLKSNLEEVINLQKLSDELMQLAQYQKKNGNTHFEKISLLQLVQYSIKKIYPLAQKKEIQIVNKIIDIQVLGNVQSLEELFTILLDNAVKYSKTKTTITLLSKQKNKLLQISVKDQGIGIEKKNIQHIFDRFYRIDRSRTKEEVSGYGLGLSIAKKIVEMHKGTINVISELGKGTEFIISFPITI
ncbi:MAG: HAMP domain-containing sensor histidine kinase [bacterium]|nr:HAMP domain-containing sensor histidine kinase [bacterium]